MFVLFVRLFMSTLAVCVFVKPLFMAVFVDNGCVCFCTAVVSLLARLKGPAPPKKEPPLPQKRSKKARTHEETGRGVTMAKIG